LAAVVAVLALAALVALAAVLATNAYGAVSNCCRGTISLGEGMVTPFEKVTVRPR